MHACLCVHVCTCMHSIQIVSSPQYSTVREIIRIHCSKNTHFSNVILWLGHLSDQTGIATDHHQKCLDDITVISCSDNSTQYSNTNPEYLCIYT